MSIFPQLDININERIKNESKSLEENIPKEYAWDFESDEFLLRDGKFIVVEGKEALKIWIWKALHTVRLKYSIYSNEYGHDLQSLIGQGFSKGFIESEAKRMVWECLKLNRHIKSIENFNVSFENDKLELTFDVKTDQGIVNMSDINV